VEGAHHPVAHRLDDAPAAPADLLPDEVEVAADPAVGGRVADALIKLRGALEVAEQEGDVADGQLLAGCEHLGTEQLAELLHGGDLSGTGGLGRPGKVLDGSQDRAAGLVAQHQHGPAGHGEAVAVHQAVRADPAAAGVGEGDVAGPGAGRAGGEQQAVSRPDRAQLHRPGEGKI
jgi:hypothetical protein